MLQATMHWERVGMTPQFVKASALGQYNGPCGIYSREYSINPQCGDLSFGVLATPLVGQPGYPRRYLMRLTLSLVVDRELWTAKSVTKPSRGTTWPHGTLCRDTSQPVTKAGNCLRDAGQLLNHWVVNETKTGWNVLQYTELFDYDPGSGINAGLFPTLADVPENVTWGFNYTELRYPRCDTITNPVNPPTCYCQTIECLPSTEAAVGGDYWTVDSTITFSTDGVNFVDGVTPLTDNHSPRFTVPPIVYVPHMNPDENVTFQIAAVDEDGATRLTFGKGGTGVVSVSPSGVVTVPPLLSRFVAPSANAGAPILPTYTINHLFRARVKAIDPVPNPPISTTVEFYVKSCAFGGPVPLNRKPDGTGYFTYSGGKSTPVFVEVGHGRCTESDGTALSPMVADRIACLGMSKTWEPVWVTAPTTKFQCRLGVECVAAVTAVQLDFSSTAECSFSGVAGGVRCSSLMGSGLGAVMDYDLISANGEHAAWPDSTTFENPAVVRIYPFAGRAAYPLPYVADIGRREAFCVAARNNATDTSVSECWSPPHCVEVEVLGSIPQTVSPAISDTCPDRTAADISQYREGECPDIYLCGNSDSFGEIVLHGMDADEGETVNVKIDTLGLTNLGQNLGDPANGYSSSLLNASVLVYPLNDPPTNTYCRERTVDPTLPVALLPAVPALAPGPSISSGGGVRCNSGLMKVTFNLDFAPSGNSPITAQTDSRGYSYAAVGEDKVLCYTISDNQAAVWGRGLNNHYSRCHIVRLRAPPVFLVNPSLPLDSPFAGVGPLGLGAGEATVDVEMGQSFNFTVRARDPNTEDAVSIFFLQDPGVPLDGKVTEQVCVDHGTESNIQPNGVYRTYTNCTDGTPQGGARYCPTVRSPCSEAYRQVIWTPQPGSEGNTFRVCAIARDDKGYCAASFYRRNPSCPPSLAENDVCTLDPVVGASRSATPQGFYGDPLCVNLRVIPPMPYWNNYTVATDNATAGPAEKLGHVGCDIRYAIAATDPRYDMAIELDPSTPLPPGASLIPRRSGGTAEVEFRWTPQRGTEGSRRTVCFRAFPKVSFRSHLSPEYQEATVGGELPVRCLAVTVRRCKYCVGGAETLLTKMKEYSVDMNWLRLWAANGNDDGDPLTMQVEDPGVLSTGLLDGVANGQLLNIGPIYRLLPGETLHQVAARFRTTVKSLLDLNPDIQSAELVRVGQDLCMIPCTF
uniref:LysM domain-containing protein n=1 Tax=Hemiselmis tepida TaxID=464990 RepID=A0A7S0WBU6_9CRYP|mmetsp:Transcript_7917/g.20372  ORF Transcript_7917/g.20372 Transcript_7917/m.20372 type:complete len:1200 (+) Transcript_7917:94-3693(+)